MKWSEFHWEDPLGIESLLTEEERSVRDRARSYAEGYLQPRVVEGFRKEEFDRKILLEMGERGFLGATLQGYGCRGYTPVAYGLIARELEKVDSGYRTLFSVQSSLAMHAIYLCGNEEQKERYLPAMAQGCIIGSFALTEPDHGSDPEGMETRARRVDGGYILNGHKRWIGLAAQADLLVIWAKDEERIVRGFLVEQGTTGLSTSTMEGKLSLRCAPSCEVVMEELFVGEGSRLPGAAGLKSPFACMNMARYAIAWGAFGSAESCWRIARDYVCGRSQFAQLLGSRQLIQHKLAIMQTEIALGLLAALHVGRLMERGEAAHEMLSLIKRNATTKSRDIAREAREILGGNGILDSYHVMRHMVNLEAVHTYEGTADIHALILGRSQTGLSAF